MQVAVLVHDGHVDVLGLRLGGDGGGHGDADGLSGAQPGRGPRGGPVEENAAVVDEGLESGPGEGRQALHEPHVESQAHGLVAGDEVAGRARHGLPPGSRAPRRPARIGLLGVTRPSWS